MTTRHADNRPSVYALGDILRAPLTLARLYAARLAGYYVAIVDHGVVEHPEIDEQGEPTGGTYQSRDMTGTIVVDGIEYGMTLASHPGTPDERVEHIRILVEFGTLMKVIEATDGVPT